MKKILLYIILFSFWTVTAQATTYYVSYSGNGIRSATSWETRGNMADFESNTFGYGAGDTVCFGDTFDLDTNNNNYMTLAAYGTSAGARVTLDGSAAGDCAAVTSGGGSQAIIYIDQDSEGFYGTGTPQYLTVRGFDFKSRDSATADYRGFHIKCSDGDPCPDILIEYNNAEMYGSHTGYVTNAFRLEGPFQGVKFLHNNVTGLSIGAYDAMTVLCQNTSFVGAIQDIEFAYNIITDWEHTGFSVQLQDTTHAGTITGVNVHHNTISAPNRAYARPGGVIANPTYYSANDVIQNVWVHHNTIYNMRTAMQFYPSVNFAFYKNTIRNVRNVCGPYDPTIFDLPGTYDPYMGDTTCVEQCYHDDCSETQAWGKGAGWMTGMAVGNIDGADNIAYFQNTFYKISESSIQFRANTSHMILAGNLFLYDSLLSKGTWAHMTDDSLCDGNNDPYPCCTGSGTGNCSDSWYYVGDVTDDIPPGGAYKYSDCSIYNDDNFVAASGFANNEAFKNLWYGSPQEPFCGGTAALGDFRSIETAEGDSGYGLGTGFYVHDNFAAGTLPNLVDPDNGNFTPQTGSDVIDIGFLTNINDVDCDGEHAQYDITVENVLFVGAPGETIKTERGVTATVSSINFTTNTVTLTSSIQCNDDDGIGIDYEGLSLDAGAEEYVASTYWVDPNGLKESKSVYPTGCQSDTQLTGSNACTIDYAFDNAAAGETWRFNGGTYAYSGVAPAAYHGIWEPANSGIEGNPIIFQASTGETPVLEATWTDSTVNSFIVGNGAQNWITLDGFTTQATDNDSAGVMIGKNGDPKNTGLVIKNFNTVAGSNLFSTADNNDLWRLESVDGDSYIQNNLIGGISTASWSDNNAAIKIYHVNDVVIENNKLYNSPNGIAAKGWIANSTIRYNWFSGNTVGIYIAHYLALASNTNSFYHNVISQSSAKPAFFVYSESDATDDLSDWILYNNTIYNPTHAAYSAGWTDSLICYNNIFIGSDSQYKFATTRDAATLAQVDHNNYGTSTFSIKLHVSGSEDDYTSLATWQASGELEANYDAGCGSNQNPGCGSIASDPDFTNGSGSYSLVSDFEPQAAATLTGGRSGGQIGADVSLVGVDAGTEQGADANPIVTGASGSGVSFQ